MVWVILGVVVLLALAGLTLVVRSNTHRAERESSHEAFLRAQREAPWRIHRD